MNESPKIFIQEITARVWQNVILNAKREGSGTELLYTNQRQISDSTFICA